LSPVEFHSEAARAYGLGKLELDLAVYRLARRESAGKQRNGYFALADAEDHGNTLVWNASEAYNYFAI
jgi:hypothetical protein